MTATGEAELRRQVDALLQSVPLAPVPLNQIISRGRAVRWRRAGAAAGGLGLAGIIVTAIVLALPMLQAPAFPATSAAAAPGGVFASGTANGRAWRLAVQNIADPGRSCLPAIVISGTDADPVAPAADSGGAVSLGAADPGVYFAFIQLPADVDRIVVDGRETLPAVQVTACGEHYRLAGFAYPRTRALTVTALGHETILPPQPVTPSQTVGLWNNAGQTRAETASGVIAHGPDWTIRLLLGSQGECYTFEFAGPDSTGNTSQMGACGPVSTPAGPETIMALPLADPARDSSATGYALQVSASTARLRATLSDGSYELVTPQVTAGRKYAAFIVRDPLRLTRITWLDAAGRPLAGTAGPPRYGSAVFQP